MGKNGVKVIIRTRPTANFATNQIQIDSDDNTITVLNHGSEQRDKSPTRDGPSNRKDNWRFKYHQVLHNASQEKVYDAIARDIVHGTVIDGINGTILAYGQTGAGKSFTIIGDTRNYQHRGIAPRAIAQIYEQVENRIEISYHIKVSYMEIYNDHIYDLLEAFQTDHSNDRDLVVVEDSKGTYVRGLTQIDAPREQDALDLLFNGELQRTVAEHQLNKRSNRSHCIFTLHISQKSRIGGNEHVIHSKLHLVDLAGSERLKKTMEETKTSLSTIKKESMYINQSLSFLEQCIVALGSKEQRHIPYRQTKLTNVLKDSLGGNANTLMFACIWGESKHLEETISTLKLAQRMMRVQNEITSIVETDPQLLLRKYEKQIKDLKHELIMHDALVERTGIIYDEHTPEQKMHLMRLIQQYIDTNDKDEDILPLNSIHEIRELFRQFKILYKSMEGEIGNHSTGSIRSHSAGSTASRTSHGISQGDLHTGIEGGVSNLAVGDDDPLSIGFGVGIASGAARPSSIDIPKPKHGRSVAEDSRRSPSPTRMIRTDEKSCHEIEDIRDSRDEDDEIRPDRIKNQAFQLYKTSSGKLLYRHLQEEKEKQMDTRHKIKSISNQVNQVKERIDRVRIQLNEKRCQRHVNKQEEEEIVDEEEFILMNSERDAKREYRGLYDDLKCVQQELEFINRSVEMLRMRLVREFETWYEEEGQEMVKQEGFKPNEDKLDDGEKFDQMEIDRIRSQDPDSLAFYQAQKKIKQGQRKHMKSKRSG